VGGEVRLKSITNGPGRKKQLGGDWGGSQLQMKGLLERLSKYTKER